MAQLPVGALQRVRGIDDDLAGEVAKALGDFLDHEAWYGQYDDVCADY